MFRGPILPLIIKLSAPIFAGMLFHLLYNITDTMWISRINLSDPSYVGGTGIIFPMIFLAIAISNGITVGISSLVARGIGEKNTAFLNRAAESGLAIAIILGVLVVSTAYIFDESIVRMLGAEGDYYIHGLEYFRYIIPVAVLMFISSVFNGILQGEGQMKFVMVSMIIGTLGNIILDPIFIFTFDLGIKGAAIATGVAQLISVIYIISVFLRGKTLVQVEWKIDNISRISIRKIANIGLPQALSQIIMSISFLIFNRIVVEIDPLALTAFSLCGRFDMAVLMPIFAIGAALVTMVGQNAGRGNFTRIRSIWKTSLLSTAVVVVIIATFMIIFAHNIYSFFSDIDAVVNYAVLQTRIIEYSFVFAVLGILGRSLFQGIGYPIPALIISLLRLVIVSVPAVIVYVYIFNLGMYGVWFGLITGNGVGALISFLWGTRTIFLLEKKIITIRHS
ncbi:MAG: MATE family efflux transporter [Spirochaetales bacterium]|nr:MATE family efflux transporter [Spirochaetales bacterium]